jgi:hypothetical protein
MTATRPPVSSVQPWRSTAFEQGRNVDVMVGWVTGRRWAGMVLLIGAAANLLLPILIVGDDNLDAASSLAQTWLTGVLSVPLALLAYAAAKVMGRAKANDLLSVSKQPDPRGLESRSSWALLSLGGTVLLGSTWLTFTLNLLHLNTFHMRAYPALAVLATTVAGYGCHRAAVKLLQQGAEPSLIAIMGVPWLAGTLTFALLLWSQGELVWLEAITSAMLANTLWALVAAILVATSWWLVRRGVRSDLRRAFTSRSTS